MNDEVQDLRDRQITARPPIYRTRCGKCGHDFRIGPSMSMQMGHNSGCVSCPKCDQFLHVELLEGDEAWTEPWDQFLKRTNPEGQSQ